MSIEWPDLKFPPINLWNVWPLPIKGEQMEYDFHFFQNTSCRYFPCHENIPRREFNCMHCYCPLYFVEHCGGNSSYTDGGIRDCSGCTRPHDKNGWTWIRDRINEEIGNTKKFKEKKQSEVIKDDV